MKKLEFDVKKLHTGVKFSGSGKEIVFEYIDVEGDKGIQGVLNFNLTGEGKRGRIGEYVYHVAPRNVRNEIIEGGIKVSEWEECVYAYTFFGQGYMACVGDLFEMHGEGDYDVWVIKTDGMSFDADDRIKMGYKCSNGEFVPSAVTYAGDIDGSKIVGYVEMSSDWFK